MLHKILACPEARRALAAREIGTVYQLLTEAGVSQRLIAESVGQTQSEVHAILHGRPVLQVRVLERIADGLGVDRAWLGVSHGECGDYAEKVGIATREVDDEVKRRAFLAAASAAVVGQPVLGEVLELPAAADTPLPSRVTMADVDGLRSLTGHLRSLARQYGGQADTVGAVAERSMRLMAAGSTEHVKRELASALADLHTMAGWCCFDSNAPDAARGYFTRALELAAEAGDAYHAADAIYHAAMAMQDDDPNGSLKLLQLAQCRLTGSDSSHPRTATLTSWLNVDSAHSLAMLGHTDQARSALAAARDGWNPDDRFDRADMDHVTAALHRDLGMLESAERLAAASVRTWGEGDRRDGVQAGITLAGIHLQAGERDGLGMAEGVIRDVAALRSARARRHLLPLADTLESRPGSDARELAQQARRVAAASV
jgi:transcriptional regulator with XRE-family HTH domain